MTEETREERRKREQRERYVAGVKAAWSTEGGRHYLYKLIQKSGFFDPCLAIDNTAYLLNGMRNMGHMIQYDALDNCPDLYYMAVAENKKLKEAEAITTLAEKRSYLNLEEKDV